MKKGIVLVTDITYFELASNALDIDFQIITQIILEGKKDVENEESKQELFTELLMLLKCRVDEWEYMVFFLSDFKLADMLWDICQDINVYHKKIIQAGRIYLNLFPRLQYERVMGNPNIKTFDGIVLGISHAAFGIDTRRMNNDIANLSAPSQDLYYNLLILKNIINKYDYKLVNLKYVLIDMFDYIYFNFDAVLSGVYETFLLYSGFDNLDSLAQVKQTEEMKCAIPEIIRKHYEINMREGDCELFSQLYPNIVEQDEFSWENQSLRVSGQSVIKEEEIQRYLERPRLPKIMVEIFEETMQFQINNLQEIFKVLNQMNPEIEIFCVLMPKYIVVEEDEKAFTKEWKELFLEILERLHSQYRFEFWDFKQEQSFSSDITNYWNLTHFNEKGRNLFTDFLQQKIDEYMIEKDKNDKLNS